MSKFKVGDRVKYGNLKGTISCIANDSQVQVKLDIGPHYSLDIIELKRLINKSNIKYVLKTQILDDIYPKDHEKYAKIRIVK